jgi:antitoxin (DNA-binding transcriptional repressor) of toxin-antitoxin stability system
MIRLNVHEAKTHLSKYLDNILGGEVVVLCRRNKPIAAIRALASEREGPRPIGLDRHRLLIEPGLFFPNGRSNGDGL